MTSNSICKGTLKVAFSCDDIHPEVGYGLLFENGPLKWLKKLNEEFGCKFTVFMVPFWYGKKEFHLENNLTWVEEFKKLDFIEVAQHGLVHMTNEPNKYGEMEFMTLNPQEVEKHIVVGKQIFQKVGFDVVGFKAPGWGIPNITYDILKKHKFTYIADHFVGTKPIDHQGIWRVPYTFTINQIYHDLYQDDNLILHSHISPKGGNLNAWNESLYNSVRAYLQHLVNKHENVEFVFMKDLVTSEEK